jgi:diguanylate cyclase (GGDEF)-like protein
MANLLAKSAPPAARFDPSAIAAEPTISRSILLVRLGLGLTYLSVAVLCAALLPQGHGFSIAAPAAAILFVVGDRTILWQSTVFITCKQAAFVLLVFTVPFNLLPLLLPALMALGLPRGGRSWPMQLLVSCADSWYGLAAPALLAVLEPGPASWNHWSVYLLAFGGQIVLHEVMLVLRRRLLRRTVILSEDALGLAFDVCLTPIGIAAAIALNTSIVGALILLTATTGVLALAGREHQERWRAIGRAFRDPLTGLANRAFFDEASLGCELRCRRNRQQAALILIDLDDFKPINDTFGHHAGDEVLCAFADKLRASVRAVDVPARLGGDEFAVVLAEPMDLEGAGTVAEKLRAKLTGAMTLATGDEVNLHLSIGYALFGGDASAQDALITADNSLYEDKRRRKGSFGRRSGPR